MKRKSAFGFLVVFIIAIVSPAGLVMRFVPAMAHSGLVLSAWTWNAPIIDGVIGEGEWSAAAKVDFNITTPDVIYNGTIYVMNDYNNLYLAAKITDDDFGNNPSTFDVFAFFFDNDNSGLPPVQGDDGLFCWSISGYVFDAFFNSTGTGWPGDTQDGGTQDGTSAASGDGSYNYFECVHPLDSSDDAHDFSLKFRDVVGFCVGYTDNGTGAFHFWPSSGPAWHDIKIAAPFWQGDLVLSDSQVYNITGEFNINGSIIVTENATLILENAFITFTQLTNFQFNITLKDAVGGNPHIVVNNATIDTGGHHLYIALYENSTAQVNELKETISSFLWLEQNDVSSANVADSDFLGIELWDSSSLNLAGSAIKSVQIHNNAYADIAGSVLWLLYAVGNSNVQVQNSEITYLEIYSSTEQTIINDLRPATVAYWNYLENCSVIVDGGFAPNVTLTSVMVSNWYLSFVDAQHTIIYNSELYSLTLYGSSEAYCYDSYIEFLELFGSSMLEATDSMANHALLHGTSRVLAVNSTAVETNIADQAAVYVNWYLDVYVKDSTGQDVPDANVTVICADGTVTANGTTNMFGWVKLTVLSSIINATGEYPQGPHNVTATYEIYSNTTTVNVNENKQATVVLSEFVIPEFPLLPLMIMTFAAASTASALLSKSKNTGKKH